MITAHILRRRLVSFKDPWKAEVYRIVATEGPVDKEQTVMRAAPLVPGEKALRFNEQERARQVEKRVRRGLKVKPGGRSVSRDQGWLVLRAQRRVVWRATTHLQQDGWLVYHPEDGTLTLGKDPRLTTLGQLSPRTRAALDVVRERGEAGFEEIHRRVKDLVPEEDAVRLSRTKRDWEREKRRRQGVPELTGKPYKVPTRESDVDTGRRMMSRRAAEALVRAGWAVRDGDTFVYVPWWDEEAQDAEG